MPGAPHDDRGMSASNFLRACQELERGGLEAAEDLLRSEMDQNGPSAEVCERLAFIYGRTGRLPECRALLEQTLQLDPFHPKALANQGVLLRLDGDLPAAEQSIRKALSIQEDFPEAWSNLGVVLKEVGRVHEAILAFRRALVLRPDSVEVLRNLGSILQQQRSFHEAVPVLRRLSELSPEQVDVHRDLALCLGESDRRHEAMDVLIQACGLHPAEPSIPAMLSLMLVEEGKLAESEVQYLHAASLALRGCQARESSEIASARLNCALSTLGLQRLEAGHPHEALTWFRRAVKLEPENACNYWNLSYASLMIGDYALGWEAHDWRLRWAEGPRPICQPPAAPFHADQERVADLLLVGEQGLGDILQFARLAPEFRSHAERVSLCVPPSLCALVRGSGLVDCVIAPEEGQQWSKGPWLPLLSAPAALGMGAPDPRTPTAYLKVPERVAAQWRERIRGFSAHDRDLVVGLAWQSNVGVEEGLLRGRSIAFEQLLPVLRTPGVRWLSVQKGPGSQAWSASPLRDRFVDAQQQIDDSWEFVDSAAALIACDLVISVDTVFAHLAGGLGCPTWVLLKFCPDWRWGFQGERTAWYPRTRLFRQRRRGDWREPLERVATELERLVAASVRS